jgi:hypothetical protein
MSKIFAFPLRSLRLCGEIFKFFLIPLASIVFMAACGPDLSRFDSLLSHQPRVVAVDPPDGFTIGSTKAVSVIFSIPIEPTSIGPNSFTVMQVEQDLPQLTELAEDVSKGDTQGLAGSYQVAGDGRTATFEPEHPLEAGSTYGVLITNAVQTSMGIPLNQMPGEGPTPFWSTFIIKDINDTQTGVNADTGTDENTDSGGQVSQPDSSGGENNNEAGGGSGEGGSQSPPPPERPSKLVINEILYDAAASDTDGNEFVELAGDAGADIGDYSVVLINGADGAVTETIKIPTGSLIPTDGIFLIADSRTNEPTQTNIPNADLLNNFDPQNGPDCAELLDDHGALLDAVGYGLPLPQKAQNGLACYEGSPGPDAPAGKSITRTNALDTNNNAVDFKIIDVPTPGAW